MSVSVSSVTILNHLESFLKILLEDTLSESPATKTVHLELTADNVRRWRGVGVGDLCTVPGCWSIACHNVGRNTAANKKKSKINTGLLFNITS